MFYYAKVLSFAGHEREGAHLWCSLVPKDPLSLRAPVTRPCANPKLARSCSMQAGSAVSRPRPGSGGGKHHKQQRCAPYTALPCCHALARPKLAEHAAQALGSASVVLITRIQNSRCQRTTGTGQVRVPECDAGRARTVQPLLSPV